MATVDLHDNFNSVTSGETGAQSAQPAQDEGTAIIWRKVWLKPNITTGNFVAMIAHYTLMTFIFVSVEVLQPILFSDRFPSKDPGRQNANVLIADIVTKLLFAPFFGVMNDRFGRQYVLIYGIVMASLALFLMPFCSTLYPEYLLCRILYAHGAIAIATIPLLADYIKQCSKGRVSSINVVGASFGAIISSSLITNSFQEHLSISSQYYIVSGSYFVLASLYTFFLKRGVYFIDEAKDSLERRDCIKMFKVGMRQARCPWILMGYVTNFLSRADSILLTLFLVLWAQNSNGD
jgi:MFS family permease